MWCSGAELGEGWVDRDELCVCVCVSMLGNGLESNLRTHPLKPYFTTFEIELGKISGSVKVISISDLL